MIQIGFSGDDYSSPVDIKIRAPRSHWLGKVESGSYALTTPDSHARKNMMPLPAVRALMENGDLPFVRFGKKAYVLEKLTPPTVETGINWRETKPIKNDDGLAG